MNRSTHPTSTAQAGRIANLVPRYLQGETLLDRGYLCAAGEVMISRLLTWLLFRPTKGDSDVARRQSQAAASEGRKSATKNVSSFVLLPAIGPATADPWRCVRPCDDVCPDRAPCAALSSPTSRTTPSTSAAPRPPAFEKSARPACNTHAAPRPERTAAAAVLLAAAGAVVQRSSRCPRSLPRVPAPRYPDRIPVICEKDPRSDIPPVDKRKYLIPMDLVSRPHAQPAPRARLAPVNVRASVPCVPCMLMHACERPV